MSGSEPTNQQQQQSESVADDHAGPSLNADESGQAPAPGPEEPTVGTGSVVAIGCVIAMILVLGVGILIVLLTR